MTVETHENQPPMQPSNEAKEEQLNLARKQGESYQKAVDHMTQQEAHGAQQRAGDYLVGYAVEKAEGMYQRQGGELVWQEPQDENVHIEITVQDNGDLRFIPGLTITVTVIDPTGNNLGTHTQPFLWHPWLFHYGRNWKLPGDGTYTLRVQIDAPNFMRHDKINGQRFSDPVTVEFSALEVKTGQKK